MVGFGTTKLTRVWEPALLWNQLHSQRLVVVECHDENFGWDVSSRRTLGLCAAVCPSRWLLRRCTVGRSWDHSREIESESLFSSLRWRESHASEFPAPARNSERRVRIESGPVLSPSRQHRFLRIALPWKEIPGPTGAPMFCGIVYEGDVPIRTCTKG